MDQMEKKQITNSSTVSRAVKDPHRAQGQGSGLGASLAPGILPCPAFVTYPSVELVRN